jgi:O-acetyl-ADP-ribose deacetylase (regulator of RNase III)
MGPKIMLYLGDITDLSTDAIVNAANNYLVMGSGVAGAIKKKGGQIIEDEAVKKGPIPIGEAIWTTGGDLKAKYVIHAAGMGKDLKTNPVYIKDSTLNSLKRADELKLISIAFPAIGTGVGGFSIEECAKIMLDVIRDYLPKAETLKTVIFALFDKGSYEVFEKELEKIPETS